MYVFLRDVNSCSCGIVIVARASVERGPSPEGDLDQVSEPRCHQVGRPLQIPGNG